MKTSLLRAAALLLIAAPPAFAAEKEKSTPESPAKAEAPSVQSPAAVKSPAPATDTDDKPARSPAEQLTAEQKKLGAMRLRYDEKHPAVVKQRAKVIRLQKEAQAGEANQAPKDRAGQLEQAKSELDEMLKRYTDQHPLVVAQHRKIAALEAAK